jgi:hypothetical protein
VIVVASSQSNKGSLLRRRSGQPGRVDRNFVELDPVDGVAGLGQHVAVDRTAFVDALTDPVPSVPPEPIEDRSD